MAVICLEFGHMLGFRLTVLRSILRPLVRFVLKDSHSVQEFGEVVKQAFVDVAIEELSKNGQRPNVNRVSIMTGLHRLEVGRIMTGKEAPQERAPLNSLLQILGRWEQDPRFATKGREPRVLQLGGPDESFSKLVHSVSKNLTPGTVYKELERRGFVEKTARGVRRKTSGDLYRGEDLVEKYQFLANDINELVRAVEENIENSPTRDWPHNLHISTMYDNIRASALPSIRRWFVKEGRAFHKKARDFLSQYDQDFFPEKLGEAEAGRRVYVSSFSTTDRPLSPTDES